MALLGGFVNIKTGKLDANAAVEGGQYPFFTCSRANLEIDKYAFDADAILVAGNGDLNVKHYKGKFNAYQRTYVITVEKPESLDTRYLYHWMSKYVDRLRELSIGGVIKYIKLGMLTDAEIPLPPLEEQKRIATILDKADAIRRKRQQAIDLADQLLRSVFLDMFGDPVTNPKGWDVEPMIDLIDKNRPITYGILKPGPELDNGIPYVRVVDMRDKKVLVNAVRKTSKEIAAQYKRSTLIPGDILLSIRGHVGRVALTPKEMNGANITQDTARLAPNNKITNLFLMYCLDTVSMQRYMQRLTKGGAVKGINLADVKEFPIPVPDSELQDKFNKIVLLLNSKLEKQLASLEKANDVFASLTQRAFRGELDKQIKAA